MGSVADSEVLDRPAAEAVVAQPIAPTTTAPSPAPLEVTQLVADQIAEIFQKELEHERGLQRKPNLDPIGLCADQKLRVARKIAKAFGS